MSQQNKSLRLPIALAIAAVIAVGVFAWAFRRHDAKPVVNKPAATSPATQPATQPLVTVEPPPRTYFELIHREFPRLATTQPIDQPLNMRDWGHFLIAHPLYIDRRGALWITHPEAEETEALLTTAATRQINLTRERVLYAHWFFTEGGEWAVMLVVASPRGGFEIVGPNGRRPIGAGDDYDWSRAFSIYDERKIIVPRTGRVSVFTTDQNISETVSPNLAGNAAVQLQVERGVLAWVPPEDGHAGSNGAVRFVDGKWLTLGADQGWPANLLHLIPLADGTVLQIIAEEKDRVRLAYAALDEKKIDEERVARLIIELSDPDAQKREKAFAELTKFGPGLWPIAEKMMDTALPDAQERLKSLLKSKLTPLLGGMQLPDGKLRVISRFAEGGVLFSADNGVLIPHGDLDPQLVKPAWIVARPGYPVQLLDADITQAVDPARAQITASGNEWIITDDAMGPQRQFAGALVPLLRKSERRYAEFLGIDARGRYVFREPLKMDRPGPATRPTTSPASRPAVQLVDAPTLVIDPTLPDPLPRLPVWHITVKQGSVGWTADGWPVMKAGGAWALGTRDWRSLDEKIEKMFSAPEDVPPPPEFKPELPATKPTTFPTTQPSTTAVASAPPRPLLQDPEGNWYFEGGNVLKVVSKTGKEAVWVLPGQAAGDAEPWLVRTPEGLLFLFNQPGRLSRIRATPNAAEPFTLEATFSRNIPNEPITRMWVDPAGRIVIAWGGNQLAILFPLGFIPPATDRIIPANEQGVAGDE